MNPFPPSPATSDRPRVAKIGNRWTLPLWPGPEAASRSFGLQSPSSPASNQCAQMEGRQVEEGTEIGDTSPAGLEEDLI